MELEIVEVRKKHDVTNAKQYFKRIKQIHFELLAIQGSIDMLHDTYGITSVGNDGVCVQHSKEGSSVEDTVLKVATLIEEQKQKQEDLADMIIVAMGLIDNLPDSFDRSVMIAYYINNLTGEQAADLLFVDVRTIWRSLIESLDIIDTFYFGNL